MQRLTPGQKARVTVPGSSANLGPGFDSLGLAVDLCDTIEVEVIESGLEIEIHGEGASHLPTTAKHLVYRGIKLGLSARGATVPGLRMVCHNQIPQSRGLGSSAAAAVGGVALAGALAGQEFTPAELIQLASEFEGHPDNVAASVLGGAVVSWTDFEGEEPKYSAVAIPVHPAIRSTALVPNFHASTNAVRKVLPELIPHTDARFNVARSSLMTVALSQHPELLMPATEDKLHQDYRAEALPVTTDWVRRLRAAGHAAFVSGAGPTCMALTTEPVPAELLDQARSEKLRVLELAIGGPVTVG